MTATATGAYATTAALKALIGTTDSDDDAELGLICDRVNQLIESTTRQVIAPISSATYLYDVAAYSRGYTYFFPYSIGMGLSRIFAPMPADGSNLGIGGLRTVTLLELAPNTGGTFETIAAGDYFLRERVTSAGPYKWLCLSDKPAGSYSQFPVGRGTVRVTGTAGWTAIPDDLTDTALAIAQRAWNARQQGQQNVEGRDLQGRPIESTFLSGRDKATLKKYTLRSPV